MSKFKQMSDDDFAAIFRPLPNHLDENASFDFGGGVGTLFETYGLELAYVKQQDDKHIWTLCSGDHGDFITSGFHFVNRLGYFVCERSVPDGIHIEVALPDNSELVFAHTRHECRVDSPYSS